VEYYAGIDVSLELSSVCVVDGRGKIVKEAKVASEPEALVYFFKELGFPVNRIRFEAGPLSQWLHAGREGGIVGDDREDGPQGCVWACPSAADGMVPAGARQIDLRIPSGLPSPSPATIALLIVLRKPPSSTPIVQC